MRNFSDHKTFCAALVMISAMLLLSSCKEKQKTSYTPWGTEMTGDGDTLEVSKGFSLSDIISNGEMIMLTLSGPKTYYTYRGVDMGTSYMLCERFAQSIGVSLRVELCRDTVELVRKLNHGDGDLIAFPLTKSKNSGNLLFCGARETPSGQWAVREGNEELAKALDKWFRPQFIDQIRKEESSIFTTGGIQHKVYSPMLDGGKGVISKYDHLFKKYAPMARVDWRLMAAQCYQESGFDPLAKSWAGYCGLMAIMPGTANELGIPHGSVTDPEINISASAQVMAKLYARLQDIKDPLERLSFMLGSYNAGIGHIRDAMALARKHGKNSSRWDDVAPFVLKLQESQYYTDPVVKYGYMRGCETYNYVYSIQHRWREYRGQAGPSGFGGGEDMTTPHRATKKYRFDV